MTCDVTVDSSRVRALRESRGWSQEHLANAAGIGLRTVQRLESQGNASRETLLCVAAALETDIASLLHIDQPSVSGAPVGSSIYPPNAPFYVRYGLYGLYTRKASMGFMWLSFSIGAFSLITSFFVPHFAWGAGMFLAALWYWAAAHWLDHHGHWADETR